MRIFGMRLFLGFTYLVSVFAVFAIDAPNAHAFGKREKAERLVADAAKTLNYFANESSLTGLWDTADDAKAIIIVPDSYRAGFIVGGSGGRAVMVARNDDGSWSGPTFIALGSISFGFQAGGEISELVLLAMTNRGKEKLLSSSVKLGGDVSIAAGPVGVGAKAKTTDILAFSRSRGLYGGISLEGSVLKTRKNWNKAYYGKNVSAVDIVYRGIEDRPASLPLRRAAFALANKSQSLREGALQSQSGARTNVRTNAGINVETGVPVQGTASGQGRQPAPLRREGSISPPAQRYDDDAVYGAPIGSPARTRRSGGGGN